MSIPCVNIMLYYASFVNKLLFCCLKSNFKIISEKKSFILYQNMVFYIHTWAVRVWHRRAIQYTPTPSHNINWFVLTMLFISIFFYNDSLFLLRFVPFHSFKTNKEKYEFYSKTRCGVLCLPFLFSLLDLVFRFILFLLVCNTLFIVYRTNRQQSRKAKHN